MYSRWLLVTALLMFSQSGLGSMQSDAWKGALKQKLAADYKVSTQKAFATFRTKNPPGTVLLLKQGGFIGTTPDAFGTEVARFNQTGELVDTSRKGATVDAGEHAFKAGERVFLFRDVTIRDDKLQFYAMSVDYVDVTDRGTTRQIQFKILLQFDFPNGYLPTADYESIKKTIETVLVNEADATAVQTKTIGVGQSQREVEGVLGKPEKILNLGSKVIWVYKDIKVTFEEGKVADIQ